MGSNWDGTKTKWNHGIWIRKRWYGIVWGGMVWDEMVWYGMGWDAVGCGGQGGEWRERRRGRVEWCWLDWVLVE